MLPIRKHTLQCNKLFAIYKRTLNNCLFYERENKTANLLNEIGVLRGVVYCLETVGVYPYTPEFLRLIDLQNELTKEETQ